MSGPGRRFDPSELRAGDGADPSDAELAEALAGRARARDARGRDVDRADRRVRGPGHGRHRRRAGAARSWSDRRGGPWRARRRRSSLAVRRRVARRDERRATDGRPGPGARVRAAGGPGGRFARHRSAAIGVGADLLTSPPSPTPTVAPTADRAPTPTPTASTTPTRRPVAEPARRRADRDARAERDRRTDRRPPRPARPSRRSRLATPDEDARPTRDAARRRDARTRRDAGARRDSRGDRRPRRQRRRRRRSRAASGRADGRDPARTLRG